MFSFLPSENKKHFKILIHACAWIVYASFIYAANYLADPHVKAMGVLLFLLPFCVTFYLSLFFLGLYKNIRMVWCIASFLLGFLIMGALGYIYMYWLMPALGVDFYRSSEFKQFVKAAVLGYVQYFAFAMLYFYLDRSIKKEREVRQLTEDKLRKELENSNLKTQELKAQKDKLHLEYAFLRSQVNPHFLHNTLNVLYSQAQEYSEELADNISKLARMMRYSVESVEYESDKVPVQKELENLKLLIQINNIRFQGSKIIDFTIDGEIMGQAIPPLSMITVVENAFKYGDLKDSRHPLKIHVRLRPDEVYFYCRNKKRKNNFQPSSTNIGITNLRKRLDVGFKGQYEMQAWNEEEFYTFELTIFN